jgi:RNA polymerase sigma-70 factor (ECF subfamily)
MDAGREFDGKDERMRAVASHRVALTGHCYRMLASAAEADDAVQETMLRAFKSIERFEGRAQLRTWLHRIATNVCLDMLSHRKAEREARVMAMDLGAPFTREAIAGFDGDLRARPLSTWIEPIADAAAIDARDPSDILVMRQSIRLAFIAALQHLPPKQRAALLLTEVLGWSAQEVAEALSTTVPAVHSALQRARGTLAEHGQSSDLSTPLPETSAALLDRYVDAFHRYDVPALTQLLRDDAVMSMPPLSLWFRGPGPIGDWLSGPGIRCTGSRLVPVDVCGTRGLAQYRAKDGGHVPWALIVVRAEGDRIAELTFFLETAAIFPRFGLPPALP